MKLLAEPLFSLYALSLPHGHGFGSRPPVGAWITDDGKTCGAVTRASPMDHGVLVMRRRTDQVWTVVKEIDGIRTFDEARNLMSAYVIEGQAAEPIPSGTPRRPNLYELQGRTPSDVFNLLTTRSHHPAALMLYHLYLALPNPDANWVSDCQTGNFHTRLWEAILIGAFREQGHLVTQPHESPDFRIENRLGGAAWVEAVTANSSVAYNHVNAPLVAPPPDRKAIFSGAAALRFAKTLGSKLQRRYDLLPHVKGHPLMIALADFHAAGSMMWSREALIGYLYAHGADLVEVDGRQHAQGMPFSHLDGPTKFRAGLFADEKCPELSAVIFSNACSMAKLNRVGVTLSGAPEGLRYMRVGKFFDRTPGAVEGLPFCLDVTGDEYLGLWPDRQEPWSAELEVFHNPFARHPVSRNLLPEATHWFRDAEGDLSCAAFYEPSILWSQTYILDADKPPLTLEQFMRQPAPMRGN